MIVICYDGSPDAEAAIHFAGELFPAAPATVLTVWERFVEVLARTGAGIGQMGYMDIEGIDAASEESARTRAQEGVERAATAGLDTRPQVRCATSTIAEAILSTAAELDAQAIVIGTRGLRGLKSLLLGSVSHAVVQHADRPVVVVPSPTLAQARAARQP